AAELRIAGAVDQTHAAGAQLGSDLVASRRQELTNPVGVVCWHGAQPLRGSLQPEDIIASPRSGASLFTNSFRPATRLPCRNRRRLSPPALDAQFGGRPGD